MIATKIHTWVGAAIAAAILTAAEARSQGEAPAPPEKTVTGKTVTDEPDTDEPDTGKTGVAEKGVEKDVAEKDGAAALQLARVSAERVRVRCFASAGSPVYEDELAPGSVVEVGTELGEFRQVKLPLGVVGYVARNFTSEPEDGFVTTTAERVSFRYRPTPKNRAEVPVQTLEKGTRLYFLAAVGDWWRVRYDTRSAYLAVDEIEVPPPASGATGGEWTAAHARLVEQQRGEWDAAVASLAAVRAEAAVAAERTARFEKLQASYQTQLGKELEQQELDPIVTGLTALVAELTEDAALAAPARRLQSVVTTQRELIRAARLLGAEVPAPVPPEVEPIETPRDALARFDALGWLAHDARQLGAARYRLMKGGRIVSYVFCNSMRYDLRHFEGVEIGVIGSQKVDGGVPYLEIRRIEVLGHPR